jgi:hypothetical protein
MIGSTNGIRAIRSRLDVPTLELSVYGFRGHLTSQPSRQGVSADMNDNKAVDALTNGTLRLDLDSSGGGAKRVSLCSSASLGRMPLWHRASAQQHCLAAVANAKYESRADEPHSDGYVRSCIYVERCRATNEPKRNPP